MLDLPLDGARARLHHRRHRRHGAALRARAGAARDARRSAARSSRAARVRSAAARPLAPQPGVDGRADRALARAAGEHGPLRRARWATCRTSMPGSTGAASILFRIDATSAGYTARPVRSAAGRVQERLERLPGVRAATFSSVALLSGTRQNKRIAVPGYAPRPGVPLVVNTNGLAPNFFAAMELPLVLGRGFTAQDDRGRAEGGRRQPDVRANYLAARSPSAAPHRYRTGADGSGRDRRRGGRREVHRAARRAPATIYLPALPADRRHRELRAAPGRGGGAAMRPSLRQSEPASARSTRRFRC